MIGIAQMAKVDSQLVKLGAPCARVSLGCCYPCCCYSCCCYSCCCYPRCCYLCCCYLGGQPLPVDILRRLQMQRAVILHGDDQNEKRAAVLALEQLGHTLGQGG